MSAPIDDLLYSDNDSGDEDVPMRSMSGVPLTTGALAPALATPPASLLTPAVSAPATVAVPTAKTSAPTPIRQAPMVPTPTVQQAPGSGQQMFQQMFALLKQMLPVEQYATLHSEMRKGNGNDIKSIVDIIKRIAGDAIFSSVIQKMDLSRTFPTGNASGAFGSSIKPEPTASTSSSPAAKSVPLAAHSTGVSTTAGATTASPKKTLAASNIRPIASAPLTATASSLKAVASHAQRPSPIQTPARKASPPRGTLAKAGAAKPVKMETSATSVNAATTPTTASGATIASTSAATTSSSMASQNSRSEALEKIMFAKRLLSHAATCTLSHGLCQVKKCDDVRRVFKHSVSCGGANGCSHCEQLKGLVKYHIKECPVGVAEHCTIPFCDPLRRDHIAATTALAARNAAAQASAARARGAAGISKQAADSDDDDNTPLSSAVSKAKKHSKAKSPKSSAAARGTAGSHNSVPKRKGSNASNKASHSSMSAGTTSTSMASSTAASATTSSPSAASVQKGKAAVPNMTQEYGRLLQLILHVEKCKTINCPVGEECAESKALLQQIYSPNAPARAKTYKQVYGHYKTCVAKKNTQNCPMCKIGLLPILPGGTGASPSASPRSQAGVKGAGASASITTASVSGTSASPSSGAAKRGSSAVSPTPRSPLKKARSNSTGRSKSSASDLSIQNAAGADVVGQELTQASVGDIRKEADVLTHTGIDLSAERRTMMESGMRRPRMPELLPCKKEEWVEKDLFNSEALRTRMREVARRAGVELGSQTSEVMSYALHEYLKQVMEEMVEVSKQRGDSYAQTLKELQKRQQHEKVAAGADRPGGHMELTATDILRVSCEDSFTKLRQEDLALRSELLEDAKREEQIEKERAKKRKKVDRSKQTQDERDEAEMDVEELAVKDLKERLLQNDKEGVVKVDGRVNESISTKYTPHADDNQVTMEDASYWLLSQKPYIHPKLFVRAEAARIVTKALL